MNISIGQKVVCVDAKFDAVAHELYTQFPMRDEIYVIRDVRLGIQTDCKTGDVSVLLIGVVNPYANSRSGQEYGFRADRFRPLEDIKAEHVAEGAINLPHGTKVFAARVDRPCSIEPLPNPIEKSKAQLP